MTETTPSYALHRQRLIEATMAEAPSVTRAFAEEQVDFLMGEGCVLTDEQYEAALAAGQITDEGSWLGPVGSTAGICSSAVARVSFPLPIKAT